ncbi:hypothetical protein [Enterococcus sp. AZ196]|uniref:hypothetical protein n=1 Tax=Enterococcus sp. AZ196 TaxID=2774659 RepID=UPI003D2C7A3E
MIEKGLLKVGTILYERWGYDQTNIDFYEVVKISDKSIWLKEIEASKPPHFPFKGNWVNAVLPVQGKLANNDKPHRRAIKKRITINHHGVLRIYNSDKTLIETGYC